MKKTLEKLWNEYLLDECGEIDTLEEQRLAKKAADLHEKATALLNKEKKDRECVLRSLSFSHRHFFL